LIQTKINTQYRW